MVASVLLFFSLCEREEASGLTPTQSFKGKTSTPLLAIVYCQKAVSHMATPNYRLLRKCSLAGCPDKILLHGGREECVRYSWKLATIVCLLVLTQRLPRHLPLAGPLFRALHF